MKKIIYSVISCLLVVTLVLSLNLLSFANTSSASFENSGTTFAWNSDRIQLTKFYNESPRTFEAWLNMPADIENSRGTIFGSCAANWPVEAHIDFEIFTNGNPRLYWHDGVKGKTVLFDKIDVRTGEWLHLSIVRDTDKVLCYVNGDLKQTVNESLADLVINDYFAIGGDMRIPATTATSDDTIAVSYFKGELADVSVWSDVRSDKEIESDMISVSSEAGLMGAWTLDTADENAGKNDISSNKNNGVTVDKDGWIDAADFETVEAEYSIVVVPDQQLVNIHQPEMLDKISEWFAANKEKENIKLAINVGDTTDTNIVREWEDGKKMMDDIYASGVPYVIVPGNHDYAFGNGNFSPDSYRDSTLFNTYFPTSDATVTETVAGYYEEGKMDNTYHLFEAEGHKYLVVALEFGPRNGVLDWANEVISQYSDRETIVVTHGYSTCNGTSTSTKGYLFSGEAENQPHGTPSGYTFVNLYGDCNDGDDMWNKLISRHGNISMVLCGHDIGAYVLRNFDETVYGNTVVQLKIDGQGIDYGYTTGKYEDTVAMLGIMRFTNGGKKVDFSYYSTVRDQYYYLRNQFSFETDVAFQTENGVTEDVISSAKPHPEQKGSTDIGIDYNGNPVNLDYWSYEIKDNSVSLIPANTDSVYDSAYLGKYNNGKITGEMPMYINGLPVTDISYAFTSQEDLVYMPYIPYTVEKMQYTFSYCRNLKHINFMPDSVTDLTGAFMGCTSLTSAPKIPAKAVILDSTFAYSSVDVFTKLPETVESMERMFYYCKNVSGTIEIPENVKEMSEAFDYTNRSVTLKYTSGCIAAESYIAENSWSVIKQVK